MKIFKILFTFGIITALGICALQSRGIGTSGVSWLKMGVGARAAGMGNAFSPIANDASAVYWNPAGLTQVDRMELEATYNQWFEKIRYAQFGLVKPFDSGKNVLGIGLNWIGTSGIQETTWSRPAGTGNSFDASGSVMTVSYGRRMGRWFSVGASMKYIREILEQEYAVTYALDAGMLARIADFSVALSVQNIGKSQKFMTDSDPLPLNYRVGFGYLLADKVSVAVDANKPVDDDIRINSGVEVYFIKGLVAFRTGYVTGADIGLGISGGLGLNFENITLNYAFVPFDKLGNANSLSLSMRF
jgi:hypothetical protein